MNAVQLDLTPERNFNPSGQIQSVRNSNSQKLLNSNPPAGNFFLPAQI